MDKTLANDAETYAVRYSLKQFTDPSVEKPVYRRYRASRPRTFDEMDEHLALLLRSKRQDTGLRMADFAELIGLSTAVYGRYERAISKLTVTRLIHVCEVLDVTPFEMLFEAEPQVWGASEQEARDRLELAELSMKLPYVTARELLAVVRRLPTGSAQSDHDRRDSQSEINDEHSGLNESLAAFTSEE